MVDIYGLSYTHHVIYHCFLLYRPAVYALSHCPEYTDFKYFSLDSYCSLLFLIVSSFFPLTVFIPESLIPDYIFVYISFMHFCLVRLVSFFNFLFHLLV